MSASPNSSVQKFTAPWSGLLKISSALITVIFLGCLPWAVAALPNAGALRLFVGVGLPLAMVLAMAFMVKGFELQRGFLFIKRPLWKTRFPLADLQSVTIDPNATERSIRLAGNSGWFAFVGWHRNSKLGVYRLYATNPKNAVILKFTSRTVVVTPGDPQAFAAAVQKAAGLKIPPAA